MNLTKRHQHNNINMNLTKHHQHNNINMKKKNSLNKTQDKGNREWVWKECNKSDVKYTKVIETEGSVRKEGKKGN